MDIFSVFTLLGGLAFFLYGMHVMSTGLEKMVGGKLEKTLKKMTSNAFRSLALGAGITIAIQSSSALTVMLVGLVNSGIMQLGQTVGVIMGSNIGTTLTAWIFSLSGLDSNNFFIELLKPTSFSPLIALAGVLLLMVGKTGKQKDVGTIMLGFAVLMTGMTLMSDSVAPLAADPSFASVLTMFTNPILGVLVGAVFTGIIQSSAASVGILQALSLTGQLTYGMAIPIIMGQNIGTCVTSLLSSIGTNKNAKRVACVHIMFNVIGTVVWLIVYFGLDWILRFAFTDQPITTFGIALVHSIFNVVTTVMLFPFQRQLENLAYLMIRDKKGQKEVYDMNTYEFLDERLLRSPSFAIAQCGNMTSQMAEITRDTLLASIQSLRKYDADVAAMITENENLLDLYEDKLGTFLVKLSSKALSKSDSHEISRLLHCIGDFERIGDHAVNILSVTKEMNEKTLSFSDEALRELATLEAAVSDILKLTTDVFVNNDPKQALLVEPLEQVIDGLQSTIKARHIDRLQRGVCTIELGFILNDLLGDFERVSDHCSNIAVAVIRTKDEAIDPHQYLGEVKAGNSPQFQNAFADYRSKYLLP